MKRLYPASAERPKDFSSLLQGDEPEHIMEL